MASADVRPADRPGASDQRVASATGPGDAASAADRRAGSRERALPYEKQMKEDLSAQIDRLGLDEVQKGFLRGRWLDQVLWMEGAAERAQRRYYALRLIAILAGVAVPSLIGLEIGNVTDKVTIYTYINWLTFGLSFMVAAAVALEEFFRFGPRWRHYRLKVEHLKGEGWAFFQLAGPTYARFNTHADAFRDFAARVEDALRSEADVYIAQVVSEPAGEGKMVGQPVTIRGASTIVAPSETRGGAITDPVATSDASARPSSAGGTS